MKNLPSKGRYCDVWGCEFDHWDSDTGRRELTPTRYPLIPLIHVTYHTHMNTHTTDTKVSVQLCSFPDTVLDIAQQTLGWFSCFPPRFYKTGVKLIKPLWEKLQKCVVWSLQWQKDYVTVLGDESRAREIVEADSSWVEEGPCEMITPSLQSFAFHRREKQWTADSTACCLPDPGNSISLLTFELPVDSHSIFSGPARLLLGCPCPQS